MARHVLVTGGAGYVGSHACKALASAGYTPVAYDNLVHGHEWAVRWGPLEKGDILDRVRLDEVLGKYRPEAVMHFAARSEEHTSELQSRRDLVCRLLLEKKKNRNSTQCKLT